MIRTSTATAIVLGLTLVGSGGCASKSSGTTGNSGSGATAVDDGTDANGAESDAENLATTFIGGGSGGGVGLASAEELSPSAGGIHAASLGDAAKAFYQPAGCLVVTDDPAAKKATYAFSNCTGPYGLVHVTGSVVVGYSAASANQLTLSYQASGLKINASTVDWTASAVITATGLQRDMVWDGHFTGTTRKGRAIERTNHKDYKWTVGVKCLAVTGNSDGTVTGHELKTDVINFSMCQGSCPEAGSEIKITDVTSSKVYDVKWNASDATYTGPDGKSVNYKPLCAL